MASMGRVRNVRFCSKGQGPLTTDLIEKLGRSAPTVSRGDESENYLFSSPIGAAYTASSR